MKPTTKHISIQDAAELLNRYSCITDFYGVVRKELNASDIIYEALRYADHHVDRRDEYRVFEEGGSAVVYTAHHGVILRLEVLGNLRHFYSVELDNGATILITRGRDNTISAYYLTTLY